MVSLATLSPKVGIADSDLKILTRQEWGASPARAQIIPPIKNVSKGLHRVRAENIMPPRNPAKHLTIHHTGGSASKLPLAKAMRRLQKLMRFYYIQLSNGTRIDIYLGDIPYHFLINARGEIAEGRDLKYAAYSNTIYKTPIDEHITIVLDGNFVSSQPTVSQLLSLKRLMEKLAPEHNIPLQNIKVHNQVTNGHTACPGKNLTDVMPDLIGAMRR